MKPFDHLSQMRLEIRIICSKKIDKVVKLKQWILIFALKNPLLVTTSISFSTALYLWDIFCAFNHLSEFIAAD